MRCYVALGSNLGDSLSYLDKAVAALRKHSLIKNLQVSRYYLSKPHGPQDQPDYYNAAVAFDTTLKAESLLDVLQKIENDNQRLRQGVVRWGARTLDLDLLFYGDEVIETKRLSVPHPRICERSFVLLPLKDLHAENKKLGEMTVSQCIEALSASELSNIQFINTQSNKQSKK